MFPLVTILLLGFVSLAVRGKLPKYSCDVSKNKAVIEPTAEAFLIGIFSFHEKGGKNIGCGKSRAVTMQSYEAIRFALDLVNKKGEVLNGEKLKDFYVPGIRIGMLVRDYCDQKSQAVAALQDAINELDNCKSTTPASNPKLLLGVIGASTDDATLAIADYSTRQQLPLVSYISTTVKLSDSQKYPYTMRTVPSDKSLLGVLVEVLQKLNWYFVTVVYTDDIGGMDSFMELRERVTGKGICLTAGVAMSSTDTSEATMKKTLEQIKGKGTTGVIYLGTGNVLQSLFKVADTYPGATNLQWIVTSSLSLYNTFPNNKYPRGVVAVLTGSRFIVEFEDHWQRINESHPSSENPWFDEWYMSYRKCKFPGVTEAPFSLYPNCAVLTEIEKRRQFVQDQSVEPAVHAVFTYARALRMAQADLCGATPGMCPALAAITRKEFAEKYLEKVKFTYQTAERIASLSSPIYAPYKKAKELNFDSNGDVINPEFGVWNFNNYIDPGSPGFRFRNIGSYSNGQLVLEMSQMLMYGPNRISKLSAPPSSTCGKPKCRPCLNSYPDRKYMYKFGDIIINGIFSMHQAGETPYSCGALNTKQSQVQLLEAMSFAVNNVKSKFPKLLPGVNLGILGLDDCSMSSTAIDLISDVQQGQMKVTDRATGIPLLPWTVTSYIGLVSNKLTVPVAEVMNTWKRPIIGYVPAGQKLTQSEKYPYYLSTLPPLSSLLRVVSRVLRELDWRFVQVVYSDDAYGRDGLVEMKKQATKFGICVVASHKVGLLTSGTDLINDLRRSPNIKPTVVILQNKDEIHKLMTGMKSLAAGGEFTFIGLDGWGTSEQVVKPFKADAGGVLTIKHRSSDLSDFLRHLETLDVMKDKTNPWLMEWFQHLYHCAFSSANIAGLSTTCNSTVATYKITDASSFTLDYQALSVINAVYAFAHGLHATLESMCGVTYNGVCSEFFTSRMTGQNLVENIKKASFFDGSGQIFTFNKAGYGNVPYEIYNYYGGKYNKVGSYSFVSGTFQLIKKDIRLFGGFDVSTIKPTCSKPCVACQYMLSEQPFLYIPGDLLLPTVFDIHYMGISPFVCGPIRLYGGFQNSEAMTFALDWINSGKFSSLKAHNVTLGALGFDGCSTPEQAKTLAFALHYGLFDTKRLGMKNFLPSLLQGWLSYDSGSTIKMSSILQPIGVPLVSPGATSPALLDKTTYSTFFRSIPSDLEVARVMAKMVKELGFSYIITLNAPDAGSKGAQQEFRETVESLGVCIASSLEFGTDMTADSIIYNIIRSSTRVVVVFAEFGSDILNLLNAKMKFTAGKDIVFISNRAWYLPSTISNSVIEKTIMFQKDFPIINEFKSWLQKKTLANHDMSNPWFIEYFEKYYNCSMGIDCSKTQSLVSGRFVQEATVVPTIDAVFALATGLEKTLEEKCGPAYAGVCSKFLYDTDTRQKLMQNMDSMKLKTIYKADFKFVNREREMKIVVKRIANGSVDYIAEYANNMLNYYINEDAIVRSYERVQSKCYGFCAKCESKSKNTEKFIFTPGDFILVGLFDVHKKGATPYTCGAINDKQGYQLVEAFNYAVNYVNSRQGIFSKIFRGVTLGSLSLDVCQSPLRAANLVTNLYNQNVQLFSNSTNTAIDANEFQVYIGPFDSASSIRVAEVLTKLGVPQISYGASSVELRNENYPFFLRTVPADDKQARAMVSFLKRFDIKYVQVINTNDTVGHNGKEEFAKLAFINKICIVQNISLKREEALTQQDADAGVAKLLAFPKSNAVVVFTANPRLILLAAEKNSQVAGMFLFLATDKWGADPDMLKGLDNLLAYRHVVIFDIETADLPGFDIYLDKKTPVTSFNNPWFDEYYQLLYKCSIGTPTTQYPKQCMDTSYKTLPRANSYIQDPYVLYVVNSVFSAAIGIHKTLQNICGANYQGLCLNLLNSGDQRQEILRGIKTAEFQDATMQPFFFVEDIFESDRGYHIYEPVVSNTGGKNYRYENIGSYNDTYYLKIDARYRLDWPTSCQEPSCPKCIFPPYQPSRFAVKKSPYYLNIVAVFDVHMADSNGPGKCGRLNWMSDFQNLLAFFYAIETVNKNYLFKLSNSLQLGGVAIDTCSNPSRIGQDIYSLLSGEGLCGVGGTDEMIIPPATIIGFVPEHSSNAVPVAEILTPYNLTTLSPSATSVKLNDKDIYPYFLRTVPPDNIQALVIANILNQMQWTYVSCVYSYDAYGIASYQEFLRESQDKEKKLCLALARSMRHDSNIDDARKIIQELNKQAGARAVVLFVSAKQIRLLLQAAKDLKLSRRFVWLGSDTWANSEYVVSDGLQEVAAGAITIQIRSMVLNGFIQYVKSLTLANHAPIPDDWFEEFYQNVHKCRILRSVVQSNYNTLCTGNEKLTDSMLPNDPFVFHMILAVDMIALGLNNIKKCRKENALSVSSCLALQPDRNRLIYDSILSSQWSQLHQNGSGISDDFNFRFTPSGYGDIGYDILNYRYNLGTNKHEYKKIGSWVNKLSLKLTQYRRISSSNDFVLPRSRCITGSTCNCLDSKGKTVQYKKSGQTASLVSGNREILIDPNTGAVIDLSNRPTAYYRFSEIWGTIVTTLAALGAFFGLCLFCYFLIFFPFRGSTTILGFTLLVAIICLYLMATAFVAHATPIVCAIRRFFLGFFYALAYSALLIKLLDAYRNKKKEELVYKKLGSPCGLLMCCLLLVAVQCIINIEWLILVPPEVVRVPFEGVMWPRCSPESTSDQALVMSLIFIMCILFLCVVFGLCTWSSKINCYEARWVLGMAILSILVWIVWCLVSIVGNYKVRDMAVAIGLLMNASILLVLGPVRRLRLLKEYKQQVKVEKDDYYLYDNDLNSSVDYSHGYNAAPQLRLTDADHY